MANRIMCHGRTNQRRWHKSSMVVGALALIGFLLVALPGRIEEPYWVINIEYAHGWPLVFLDWMVDEASIDVEPGGLIPVLTPVTLSPPGEPPWMAWDHWRVWRASKGATNCRSHCTTR